MFMPVRMRAFADQTLRFLVTIGARFSSPSPSGLGMCLGFALCASLLASMEDADHERSSSAGGELQLLPNDDLLAQRNSKDNSEEA